MQREEQNNEQTNSGKKAELLVAELMSNIRQENRQYFPQSTPNIFQTEQEIYTADLVSDIEQFKNHLDFCADRNVRFPCLQTSRGTPIPIIFLSYMHPLRMPLNPSEYIHFFGKSTAILKRVSAVSGRTIVEVEPAEAQRFFTNRLIDFVTTRFNSARQTPSTLFPTSGLKFNVYTSTPGYTVYYHPIYNVHLNNVFGSPTSPVTQEIKPGIYAFGIWKPGMNSPPIFIDAEYEVPPNDRADFWGF